MILLIDNKDSFVHNLARYVAELGEQPLIRRHDAITVEDAAKLAPSAVIISPGPCTPAEAGVSVELIRSLAERTPILGVCLGHQCIAAAYGGRIVRAPRPLHGRASRIHHSGTGLFRELPSPFAAGRYHSLVVERDTLPNALLVTARDDDGEIMAIEHRDLPVYGVQFHPESTLTEHGYGILARFLFGERALRLALPAGPDGLGAPGEDA